ncbi:hypothetical protein AVEN_248616-1 [Araneus ventricosus]|uniref:Uncharacterized protein n=1 Tax=Araneus ventricosus TaxID=182803 RepID=A0A4Y2GFM4_ARAVE|nr:hypothetical protein AVEN_248616-1 [Araneus ventricosus]
MRCVCTSESKGSRAIPKIYFHDEPTANHGEEANPPGPINHLLSVVNGNLSNMCWFADLTLLARRKFVEKNELHSNTSQSEMRTPLCSRKIRQDLVRRERSRMGLLANMYATTFHSNS